MSNCILHEIVDVNTYPYSDLSQSVLLKVASDRAESCRLASYKISGAKLWMLSSSQCAHILLEQDTSCMVKTYVSWTPMGHYCLDVNIGNDISRSLTMVLRLVVTTFVTQITLCITQIIPQCTTLWQKCSHFRYKIVHCGIICVVHCGICEMGLIDTNRSQNSSQFVGPFSVSGE